MTPLDVAKSIDIHSILDNLEKVGTPNDYYKINHTTPGQREMIAHRIAQGVLNELKEIGIAIEDEVAT